MNDGEGKFGSKNDRTSNTSHAKASSEQYVLYNGDCDLLIYNYTMTSYFEFDVRNQISYLIIPVCLECVVGQRCIVKEQNQEFHVNQCCLIPDSTHLDIKFLILKPINFLFINFSFCKCSCLSSSCLFFNLLN